MASSRQGGGSSPSHPAKDRDSVQLHRRLRILDRKISRLNRAVWINAIIRPWLADKQQKERDLCDRKRKWTRNALKGYDR